MTIALLTALFLSACATDRERAKNAGTALGRVAGSAGWPDLPTDCRRLERSGVRPGDPLDTALIRTDQALGRANARVRRCAGWHDQVAGGIGKGVE